MFTSSVGKDIGKEGSGISEKAASLTGDTRFLDLRAEDWGKIISLDFGELWFTIRLLITTFKDL